MKWIWIVMYLYTTFILLHNIINACWLGVFGNNKIIKIHNHGTCSAIISIGAKLRMPSP